MTRHAGIGQETPSNPRQTRSHLREATRPAGHFPGGHRRGVTPVPIPNTEVKLSTADGTAWVTVWESRSLPGLFLQGPLVVSGPFFCTEAISSQPGIKRSLKRKPL